MAIAPLLVDATSAIDLASKQLSTIIDAWLVNHKSSSTTIHAGKVTPRFLLEQGRKAPCAVVTSLGGESAKVGGGKMVRDVRRWMVFFIVAGNRSDRTQKLNLFVSEFTKLVHFCPWFDRVETPESLFTRWPEKGTVEDRSVYADSDERGSGHSIWYVAWDQEIDLGTAERYTGEPLEELVAVLGTSELPGTPNTEEVETEVGDPPA
jgi:hypothetical protein